MKKYISALSLAAYFALAAPAFAQGTQGLCPTNAQFGGLCGLNLGTIVSSLVNLIFIVAVVVALFYLIYGGFKWLTSGGDKAAVSSAREHIIAAIIGLVIIFLSYFILNFLVSFFIPGFQIKQFTLPTITGGTQ